MERKSKKSMDSSTPPPSSSVVPLLPPPPPNDVEEEEEDNEISSIVEAAYNGDPQAIDMYLNSFPPGVRFAPQDHELIEDYLYKKIKKQRLPINNVIETDIYKHNPYDLAARYKPQNNDAFIKKWYFITPRDRKYPNGNRPNRAAGDGYWKATGADTTIEHNVIGKKKSLVFYKGKAKPPGGVKTNWIMHEYRIDAITARERRHAGDMRLDDYILVRIFEKPEKTSANKPPSPEASGRSKAVGTYKSPKANARNNVMVNKAPKAKRIKAAVDHADNNNQIVALPQPPLIEYKATVDQITSMHNPPSSNCDLLSPVSNITNTNYDDDGLDEVRQLTQLFSSNSDLQFPINDLWDQNTIDSRHLGSSTWDDSVYQGYQGNQLMGTVMEADPSSNSYGFLAGTIPDGRLYPQCYFDSNNSFASQTLNDVQWDNPAYGMFPQPCNNAFIEFQTMSNVNGNCTEQNPDDDLLVNELPDEET